MQYTVGSILDFQAVKKALGKGYPMLMLDRVFVESAKKLVGVKNLTANELFFQGHFPGHPIMPGVLQVEAMRQLAELAVRDDLAPGPDGQIYMRLLEKVKFRKPNVPGNRVRIEADVFKVENGEAVVNCACANNAGVTCQAIITLAVRPKKGPDKMPALFNERDLVPETPLDTVKVMSVIPHRYPFLLIDNVVEIGDDHVIATKNVSGNEEFFCGDENNFATLPEALLCEIVAQGGCSYILSRPENAGKLGYFMSIDRAESLRPVFPGDQLVIRTELPAAKSRFGKGIGTVSVDGEEVFRVTLMFAIIDP